MDLNEFQKVSGLDYTFSQIFNIYDNQFEELRNYLLSLGDTFVIETFTNKNVFYVETEEDFKSGSILVYKNESLQVRGTDYNDSTPNRITFTTKLVATDVVKVIIIKANILQDGFDSYLEIIEQKIAEVREIGTRVQNLSNLFEEYHTRLDQKIANYNREKYLIEDLMSGYNSKYRVVVDDHADVVEKHHAVITNYNRILDLIDGIEEMTGFLPEEIAETEIVQARSGAAVLGTRLNKMPFLFPNMNDMIYSPLLREGQYALVIDSENNLTKLYQIVKTAPSGSTPIRIYNGESIVLYAVEVIDATSSSKVYEDLDYLRSNLVVASIDGRVLSLDVGED